MIENLIVKRGEVYLVDLGDKVGSEQGGIRPMVITQNDIGNKYSPTIIAAPLTSRFKKMMPTHTPIVATQYPVEKDSIVLCEQVRVLDKSRIVKDKPFFKLNEIDMIKVSRCLAISMGINIAM